MKSKLSYIPVLLTLGCGAAPEGAEAVSETTANVYDPTWTALTNAPGQNLDTCVLLTNGQAMCHVYFQNTWLLLTPDQNGSYVNGTWSSTSAMPNGNDAANGCANCPYTPLFFASAVLPDGRVVVIGGEYNSIGFATNIGFIYNPVTDTWSTQLTEAFGGRRIGDASAVVLNDGTFLLAEGKPNDEISLPDPPATSARGNVETLNAATGVFTAQNPPNKVTGASNNEENWNLLYDGRVLAVNTFLASSFDVYNPGTNTWEGAGSTAVNLADTDPGDGSAGNQRESGPCVFRADSTLFCFSGNATGKNAVYDYATNTWSHADPMDFPLVYGETFHYAIADGPAALLPNGNVLAMASPTMVGDVFITGAHFYEVEYGTNVLSQVDSTPQEGNFIAYQGRLLVLPTGEVLLTAFDQISVGETLIYSNGGAPDDSWRPVITQPPPSMLVPGSTYTIGGRLFNGFSEGGAYGDDAQMSTNYPLVRIRNNATGHVVYARTHNPSRMGIVEIDSTEVVTTQFDVPAGLESGASTLVVVVNGIESLPITINDNPPPVAQCRNVAIQAGGGCQGSVTKAMIDNGSFDPGGEAITCTLSSTGPFPVGSTTVTLTCTDPHGGTGNCTATVHVGPGNNQNCCPAGYNRIVGNSNNNALNGTAANDCIIGLGGQDTLNGFGGNDIISAGDGDDVVDGGSGNDVIFGGTGQDRLTGGSGNDVLAGDDGDDQCFGGVGDDALLGGQGQDRLFGQDGADTLTGNDGDDRLEGGNGDDFLDGSGLHDTCLGGPGTDTFLVCQNQTQ